MYYTQLIATCNPDFTEIIMAELLEAGFSSFLETETGFEGYTEEDHFDPDIVQALIEKYKDVAALSVTFGKIEKKNWNEEWEKNFTPVIVDGQCIVRAHFHQPEKAYPYDLIITPKMSFGTGHHQTTYLMLKNQLGIDHQGKAVMDAGCGTGILSIMAEKRGAKSVEAFDIDSWSFENGQENIELNGCSRINLRLGTIQTLDFPHKMDILLANINRNILLMDMGHYAETLVDNGLLLISGFYQEDIDAIMECATGCGFSKVNLTQLDEWAALLLKKGG